MSNYLCLVAIFKNESHIIKEWLDHYIREGVDKFFLIDNGSTDEYLEKLQNYPVDLKINPNRYIQDFAIKTYFSRSIKNYEWVIVCDLDEFIYSRQGFKTIAGYLESLEKNITRVNIPWKGFGSSGYDTLDKKQPDLVIPNFVYRSKSVIHPRAVDRADPMEQRIEKRSKTITRTSALKELAVHKPFVAHGEMIIFPIAHMEESPLHLNHYRIQSLDWFIRVKTTRGDVAIPKWDDIRTIEYFDQLDINEIEDRELSKKIYN